MTLRVRWLGRVPYREALAVQEALFDARRRGSPAAARAPARVHPRPARRPRGQRAGRPGVGRCRPRGGEARRRRHVPRARAARRLPDRQRAERHRCGRPRRRDPAGDRRQPRRARRRRRRLSRRLPRRVGRRHRRRPAQDLRHRCAPRSRAHDARLRPQRRSRPALHARLHRAVRHPRQAGHVAGRGGHRRVARRRSSTSSPGMPARVWGGGAIERQDVAWKHRPDDLSAVLPRRGARGACRAPALAAGRRRRRLAHRDAQARVAAPEGASTARRCWR